MVDLSDEKLMAYVDGKLTEDESKEIREALSANTDAQERVELLRKSTILLQEVYDTPAHEEVPQHLIEGIINYKDEADARPAILNRIASWFQIQAWQPVHALAIAMIFMVGIGAGWFVAGLSRPKLATYTPIMQGREFSRGLEITPSGESFALGGQKIQITPVATFKDRQGRYCRQYEVSRQNSGDKPLSYGIACRMAEEQWLTRVSVLPESSEQSPSAATKNSYTPAAEDEFAATIFSDLMATPPLGIEQEQELIRHGWSMRK